jgi:hypothetical protein
MKKYLAVLACGCLAAILSSSLGLAGPKWVPDHIVIVIEENRSASQIYGNPDMPTLNSLAAGGAKMTNAHFAETPYGITPDGWTRPLPSRPSQPNYLYLFSGHNQNILPKWFQDPSSPYQGKAAMSRDGGRLSAPIPNTHVGIANDLIPATMRPFTTPNLGAALIRAGLTFAGFSQSLPYPHFDATQDGALDNYRRKHNPVINWVNLAGNTPAEGQGKFLLPVSVNLAFDNSADPVDKRKYRGFRLDENGKPLDFSKLPTVSIVVPNEQNDGHSNSDADADLWLAKNIKPYADWAMSHNSLLIVTYDEDGSTDSSQGDPNQTSLDTVVTIFYGAGVRKGHYDERIDHLNVLATVLDRYGLLQAFRADFAKAHKGPEGLNEYNNLRAVKDVFGEGPPLH